jgi:NTE family protein
MFAAWEAGVWKALASSFRPDLIVGASAGAWNGWSVAGGVAPTELINEWMDPLTATIMQPGLHSSGIFLPDALHRKSRELADKFRARIPFGLTITEVPRMRPRLVCGSEIDWRHLAATCSIPLCFPPVVIEGRRYVDGGLLGALPLWAAQQMGATRAVALNALTALPFRLMRKLLRRSQAVPSLETIMIEPSQPLGPLRHAVFWSKENIRGSIELGERDGARAAAKLRG